MDMVFSWPNRTAPDSDSEYLYYSVEASSGSGHLQWKQPEGAPPIDPPAPRLPLADILSRWEKAALIVGGQSRCPLRVQEAHPIDAHKHYEITCVTPTEATSRKLAGALHDLPQDLLSRYRVLLVTRHEREGHSHCESLDELQECLEGLLCLPRPLPGTEVDF